jgi:hypothetical protein
MTCTLRSFILSLAALALVSAFANAQAAGKKSSVAVRPELNVLTSHDENFQVKYPQSLVRCERLDAENPDVWSPERGCAAPIPVCDNSGHSGEVVACLAYPLDGFHGSELQAAAFSVSRLDGFSSATECVKRWASRDTRDVHAERIGALNFQMAKVAETETSYVADHSIYRTFHNAACYELDVNISIALPSAYAAEDVPRKLTDTERAKIKASLTQALHGFRFLK